MSIIDMVNGRLCETLPIEEIEQIRNESYNQALEDLLDICGGGIHEGDCEVCTFAIFKDDIRIGCELFKSKKGNKE